MMQICTCRGHNSIPSKMQTHTFVSWNTGRRHYLFWPPHAYQSVGFSQRRCRPTFPESSSGLTAKKSESCGVLRQGSSKGGRIGTERWHQQPRLVHRAIDGRVITSPDFKNPENRDKSQRVQRYQNSMPHRKDTYIPAP